MLADSLKDIAEREADISAAQSGASAYGGTSCSPDEGSRWNDGEEELDALLAELSPPAAAAVAAAAADGSGSKAAAGGSWQPESVRRGTYWGTFT